MNEYLERRLTETNISLDEINSLINYNSNDSVILYTSHIDGLGSKDSDFDVYIICDNLPNLNYSSIFENRLIKRYYLKNIQFDVEYWTYDYINEIIELLDKEKADLEQIKCLYRILRGHSLNVNIDIDIIRNQIKLNKIKKILLNYYIIACRESYEDSIIQFNCKDYVSSLVIARRALDFAMVLVNLMNDNIICKMKWIPRTLRQTLGENHEITQKYLKFQVYSNLSKDDLEFFTEEMLEFIQDTVSKAIMYNNI